MNKVRKSSLKSVWVMFIAYVFLFAFSNIAGGENAQLAWLLLKIWAVIISIILLFKHRFPSKSNMIISVILAAVYMLSGVAGFGISIVINAIVVFVSSCAIFSTFERYQEGGLQFIRNQRKTDVVVSIVIGVVFGVAFGIVNYLLMKNNNAISPANPLKGFFLALNPAVSEEIVTRSIFYAYCLYCVNGEFKTKGQKFTYWFMMLIPHILPHTTAAFVSNPVEWVITIVLYVIVFGLVFALLQKKRDMLSAIITHGTVDFIRFCIFGLPI